jgi:hypothetical protein
VPSKARRMLARMTRNAAGTGHPIEFWLTVFPAAGIFIAGWGSLLLRAINRLCHDVAQPQTRAAWLRNVARGQPLRVRQMVAWWLWSTFNVGMWSEDAFELGGWITRGTLAGVTVGLLAYIVQLVIG